MNVVTLPPPSTPPPQERLLTIEDVAALPSSLPTGDVKYELDDGKLVIMAPPGDFHGAAQLKLGSELLLQGERQGHGKARTEVGVILRRNPDRLVGPDVVFVRNRSLPIRLSPEGYLETIPDLVAEVRSKDETQPQMERKVDEYLRAGVTVVLVSDPVARTITAYRQAQAPQVFSAADTLIVPDVIPEFQVAVAALFTA
jgi:Uma2 family endonuclease